MKKSLIALAVAGAFAAPAFAATGNVDVYGVVSVAIEDTDVTGSDLAVVDKVSRIGFKGSEDLGGGLKAIWQIEQGLTAAGSGVGTGTLASRNTFVGLSGDFGTFLMGRHDTPYKLGTGSLDPFSDTAADYNNGCIVGCINAVHDYRSPQAIAYISPTWSGFHFAAAAIATNDAANLNSTDTFDALSVTGVYVNGPLFGSLSYQSVEEASAGLGGNADVQKILVAGGLVVPAGSTVAAAATAALAGFGSDAWKLGLGYTFGDAKVGFIYENVDVDVVNDEITTWALNGVYNMGPIALKAAYYSQDAMGVDADAWSIGADYSLSKRTTAYAVYTDSSSDADPVIVDKSTWGLGLKHSF